MTEHELKTLLSTVTPPDETARAAAHAHWAALAKPLGGLGLLETMVEDAAALTGTETPALTRRAVLVLCADNGVVAQGVSQTDASVTRAVLQNLAARRTSGGGCPLHGRACGYGHCRGTCARGGQLPHRPRHGGFHSWPGHDPHAGRAGHCPRY